MRRRAWGGKGQIGEGGEDLGRGNVARGSYGKVFSIIKVSYQENIADVNLFINSSIKNSKTKICMLLTSMLTTGTVVAFLIDSVIVKIHLRHRQAPNGPSANIPMKYDAT